MCTSRSTILGLLVAGTTMAFAASTQAAVVVGTHTGNFSFTTGTASVPINGAATSLSVTLGKPRDVVISFSAECAVDAPAGNTSAWVDIDVLVDGVARGSSVGNGDAFCTANGTAGFDGWQHPAITVAVPSLSAGVHSVQVLGRRNIDTTGGWISDSSTVITISK